MTNDSEKNDDSPPKIIVDDDWKSRVQAEKEAFQRGEGQGEGKKAGPKDSGGPEEGGPDDFKLPPASISVLITTLATQVMENLGQVPNANPEETPPPVRKDMAKFHIDMLTVIEEKTAGNLDAEEKEYLASMLHQLRMIYVSIP